ncbi:MAG: hypothetical protein R3Y23_05280 [Bacillota bacterium]
MNKKWDTIINIIPYIIIATASSTCPKMRQFFAAEEASTTMWINPNSAPKATNNTPP